LAANATEANAEAPFRDAGVISNLYVYVISNNFVSQTCTFAVRKNRAATGSPGALSVSIGPGLTGAFEDTTNSATIAATDEVNFQSIAPSAAGNKSIIVTAASVQFTADDTSKTIVPLVNGGGISSNDVPVVTRYSPINGGPQFFASTETYQKYPCRMAFTSTDLFVNVSANTLSTSTVIKTRKNGADGGQTVTFTAAQTGQMEDTSGSDSLAVGDDFNYVAEIGGGTAIFIDTVCTTCTTSNLEFPLMACFWNGGNPTGPAFTLEYPVAGPLSYNGEAFIAGVPRFIFGVKLLIALVSVNTMTTGSATLVFRRNTAATSLSLSYSVGQTGLKLDESHVEIVNPGDAIAYQWTNTDAVGDVVLHTHGILGTRYTLGSYFLAHHQELEVHPPLVAAY